MSIAKLGVVGAGQMGSGIAHVAALAGKDVVLLDVTAELVERGRRGIEKILGRRLPRVTVPDFDYNARPEVRLEIPLADRIAAIRAKKSEDRARGQAKRGGGSGASGGGGRGGASSGGGARGQ